MQSELKVYEDLRSGYREWNAWKAERTFPLDQVSESLERRLRIVSVVNESTTVNESEKLWENAFQSGFSYVQSRMHKVAVLLENQRKPKNRLRTYKGILPNGLAAKCDCLQIENETPNGTSMFGALVNLEGVSKGGFEQAMLGAPISFAITSSEDILFSEHILDSIFTVAVSWSGNSVYVNFAKLVDNFVGKGVTIMRFGGDGGDREVSVQVFTDEHSVNDLRNSIGDR